MSNLVGWCLIPACLAAVLTMELPASEIKIGKIESNLLPQTVDYAALLPDSYGTSENPFPLLLLLHGGGGSHKQLETQQALFDELWKTKRLQEMVVVMPSAKRSLYMDFRDGSERWESFILGPFLSHLRSEFLVSSERKGTLLAGASMGGLGALRMAFKYPDQFAGVAAIEPAILPAATWDEVKPKHRFFRTDELLAQIYGEPFDAKYWEQNNPAWIVKHNSAPIQKSGLQIYLECGDEDFLNLMDGVEFLHRLLWDSGIKHEYHAIRGADHLGRTLRGRTEEAFCFLESVLNPPGPDPAIEPLKRILGERKRRAEKEF